MCWHAFLLSRGVNYPAIGSADSWGEVKVHGEGVGDLEC